MKQRTQEEILLYEIQLLKKLVSNLLIDNKNFKATQVDKSVNPWHEGYKQAYYFDPINGYDKTSAFVRGPLKAYAKAITERIESIEGMLEPDTTDYGKCDYCGDKLDATHLKRNGMFGSKLKFCDRLCSKNESEINTFGD